MTQTLEELREFCKARKWVPRVTPVEGGVVVHIDRLVEMQQPCVNCRASTELEGLRRAIEMMQMSHDYR